MSRRSDYNVYYSAVVQYSEELKRVPLDLIDKQLCLAAVKNDMFMLHFIYDIFVNTDIQLTEKDMYDIYIAIVKRNKDAFHHLFIYNHFGLSDLEFKQLQLSLSYNHHLKSFVETRYDLEYTKNRKKIMTLIKNIEDDISSETEDSDQLKSTSFQGTMSIFTEFLYDHMLSFDYKNCVVG